MSRALLNYVPAFLPAPASAELFQWLCEVVPWQQEKIHLYGREHSVPRRVAWFGDPGLDYRYSGRSHPGSGWPPVLEALRDPVAGQLGVRPNFVLLNRYRAGSDSMGWHRDDETGSAPRIASLSLGASRSFLLREEGASRSRRLMLEDGSLLVFDGRVRHSLPKTRRPIGERINLTFRVQL
jgi:alkylated DNA repair dioxygenase AlkB